MKRILAIALCLLVSPSATFARDGVVVLNSKKSHLSLFHGPKLTALEFRDPKSGQIKIRLNERGLFVGAKLVCSWPGGQYSSKDSANMVLGYLNSPSEVLSPAAKLNYKACPEDLPIKSTWGDGGTGTAALFVEIEKIVDKHAEVQYRGELLQLDLKALDGKYELNPAGSLSNQTGD